ncbi:hypothetical protein BJ986_003103 [Phycicoccus badiiscoriae]|uniref:HNH nuclease domain-containing protein n=1 Tax=Pedococcus badiiscoriae TaxID=642776 RepID=A0A852WTP4_9MICO|nr:HNH endonuclease [Pedococcus badiiscoriae]NYG08616.1 hypothetical protein [Pedococcus badiiscoriae]
MSISPVAVQRDGVQRDLWARTAAVAGRLNRAHAELVDLAAELMDGDHWGDGGFRSPEHYFVVRAGLSPAHSRDVVAVARRRAELPSVARSVAAGALSLDQAAVVAHHVPASHQRSVGELALHMTVPQLRHAVAKHAFAVRGEDDGSERSGESERRACAKPELSMHYDRDGRFQLRYSAPAPIGALVEQALKEAKDALFIAQSGETASPTYGDALEEIAHRALSSVTSTSRSSHYRVYLHLSTDGAWVTHGGAIPQRLLGRFLSDGVVQPVWETDGRPVSVGRAMRILPSRSRRLIEDRDRGCRFPGCTATRFVEIHHLRAWAAGGATDDDNQVSLCPFHHDAIDRGDFTISGDPTRPDGLVVTNRYGFPVRTPSPAELAPSPDAGPPGDAAAYQPPTGERARWADIEIPPDRDLWPRTHLHAVPAD